MATSRTLPQRSKTQSNLDTVQFALRGMWIKAVKGCPHKVDSPDVVRCAVDGDMRPCCYAEALKFQKDGCSLFKEIIREWQVEYHVEVYQRDVYKDGSLLSPEDMGGINGEN